MQEVEQLKSNVWYIFDSLYLPTITLEYIYNFIILSKCNFAAYLSNHYQQ